MAKISFELQWSSIFFIDNKRILYLFRQDNFLSERNLNNFLRYILQAIREVRHFVIFILTSHFIEIKPIRLGSLMFYLQCILGILRELYIALILVSILDLYFLFTDVQTLDMVFILQNIFFLDAAR